MKSTYLVLSLCLLLAGCKTKVFQVNSMADTPDIQPGDGQCADANGDCSLRAAVQEVNANESVYRIEVPAGTYSLDSTLRIHSQLVLIKGKGADKTIIEGKGTEGGANFPILSLRNALGKDVQTIAIEKVTIAQGFAATITTSGSPAVSNGEGGGVIIWKDARVSLSGVTIRDNVARLRGGGIMNYGNLQMTDCRVHDNKTLIRWGGGVFNRGKLTMNRCAILRNRTGVRFSNSHTPPGGGGIVNAGGRLSMKNCTVSQNEAGTLRKKGNGAGLYLSGNQSTRIINCTIAQNDGESEHGSNIYVRGNTPIKLHNSIVTDNSDRFEGPLTSIYGPFTSLGANIIQRASSEATITRDPSAVASDFIGDDTNRVDPRLDRLQQTRGTWVHQLTNGSPAINVADTAACSAQDQLKQYRNGFCDCGAVEFQGLAASNGR